MIENKKTSEQIAMKVSWNTIVANILLTIFKMVAGIGGRSAAMVSDALHSLSDVLSTMVVMVGVKMAGKKADDKHPYGHERFESVAAIILSIMLSASSSSSVPSKAFISP